MLQRRPHLPVVSNQLPYQLLGRLYDPFVINSTSVAHAAVAEASTHTQLSNVKNFISHWKLDHTLMTMANESIKQEMANESIKNGVLIVNTIPVLTSLLEGLSKLPLKPASLYVDLEGVNLGRLGPVSILSLYVLPQKVTYLIDIHTLGHSAFTAQNENGDSLKFILEHAKMPKVFFDIRNDSAALFHQHQIKINGVKDIQLMELATRTGGKEYLADLEECIETTAPASENEKIEWRYLKDRVTRLYEPAHGGSSKVFNERPMRPEVAQYCAQNVVLLPALWSVYEPKLRGSSGSFWRSQLHSAIKERIQQSQAINYDGNVKDKARGPWADIEYQRELWNEDVLDAAMNGEVIYSDTVDV
ncbi:hypothetical protein LSUB1_G002743 [Lachnellula subtilissima]|uniref:3'-5' exonuclease domain-containing protein n=1 Tax=Lachnellula subtilissima TaxID=602034 RepID=A0A8H8RWG8_9HELO|nr:hypothetical protein LSUB1_G002743 [Lachnellula subtilissima]